MEVLKYAPAPKTLGDLIHSEYDPTYTTEDATLLAGSGAERVAEQFAVLAEVDRGAQTVTFAAAGGNTGNGVLTLAGTPASASAAPGIWRIVFVEPGANAGQFVVENPDGAVVDRGTVGVAFTGDVKFTIADGATDFVAGDRFDITVAYAQVGKFAAIDFAGAGTAKKAAGIALLRAVAPDGVDAPLKVLKRGPVIVHKSALIWPAGATNNQKGQALRELGELGIVARDDG